MTFIYINLLDSSVPRLLENWKHVGKEAFRTVKTVYIASAATGLGHGHECSVSKCCNRGSKRFIKGWL